MRKSKRYIIYEVEKDKLRRLKLPPSEYQRRVRELARRLRL